jgi:5'-nucleotidase
VKFLLTNDDGIEAPGILALEEALRGLGQCITVAPDQHLSGCSHQATTHRPLELTRLAERRFALNGTPVDCTRVALLHLAPDCDWVIAGINAGGNLGADVYLSGTVAAAREGALLGKRGIAISQYFNFRQGLPMDWNNATRWTQALVRMLMNAYPEEGTL